MYSPHTSRKKVYPHGSRNPKRSNDDAMVRQLFAQLEIVFSDAHWSRPDGAQRVADQKGWVPLIKVIQLPPFVEVLKGCDRQYAVQTVQHALKAHTSSLIQLHRNGSCIRRFPLKHRVRSQVEFLFGDENFARDLELQFMSSDDGFVKVVDLLSRPAFRAMLRVEAPTSEEALEMAKSALGDSVLLELQKEGTAEMGVRRRSLEGRVVRQVEFYLSEEHLHHDGYLNELMAENGEGWIRLQDLLAFPRMKLICLPQVEAVARVLREQSEGTEVSEDLQVRPKWWVLAMGLAEMTDSDTEVGHDAPPLSPMLPWYPSKSLSDFRVMSWNILAQFLCRSELYPYANPQCLNWNYRMQLIVAEIARTRPQILCLQEMQSILPGGPLKADHYSQLREELAVLGYDAAYVRKTNAHGGNPGGANLGNAIFWMQDTFKLVKQHDLNFSHLLGARAQTDASKWYFGSPQVAQILFLEHLFLKRQVAVANTHISCAWETPVKQLVQVQELMHQIDELIPNDVPLVLGGDMNSLVGSAAYRLITEGEVSNEDPHAQIDVHDADIGIKLPFEDFTHERSLKSAYHDILGGEPLFTNFTGEPKTFAGTLDYIFFSDDDGPGGLDAKCVMLFPSIEDCQKEVALPNSVYPSDHLPLTACFTFKGPPPPAAK
eukprot:m.141724 g.141724  ORF g.141724 m.141724 type:complete len:659 (+) comp22878_c0_seq1:213-2189(+)